MSNKEDRARKGASELKALDQLEKAVLGAVAHMKGLRSRLDEALGEGTETKELLRKFTEGEEDPAELLDRVGRLEAENRELLERLKRGKEGVERLLARIRFLEEQG